MTLEEFRDSISKNQKPTGLSIVIEALWEDGAGNWDQAHELAQASGTKMGDRIHAYLHRKEGDEFNARYWYNRCGVAFPEMTIEAEWTNFVLENL